MYQGVAENFEPAESAALPVDTTTVNVGNRLNLGLRVQRWLPVRAGRRVFHLAGPNDRTRLTKATVFSSGRGVVAIPRTLSSAMPIVFRSRSARRLAAASRSGGEKVLYG